MAYKTILTVSCFFLATVVMSQDMLLQSKRYHNKWRSTIGVGGVEPIAFHLQLYKGFSCKSLRSWILEAQVGMEGLVYSTEGIPYQNGTWQGGALRYSVSYNRRIIRILNDYFPWLGFLAGVGVQAGNRNYLDENSIEMSRYAIGPMLNFNMETYVVDKRINKDQYLGVIVFASYVYHREIQDNFDISRINGGIRLNFYN